jgi:hypothetical protein
MDKVERDNILTQPITNPVLLSLKQEGAIIGDGVKSFVDRCFVPGDETHGGNDLHSWYQAYCKAHALSPLSYQKFIQRLQRVLPKHWRPSEVSRVNGKPKRHPACWEGLRVLPCFVDLALSDDDDKQPSRHPHIPNWICVKENCQDGGLQELTGNFAVTDVTVTLPSVTPLKNAETCMVTDVTTLPTQSLRNAKNSDEITRDCIQENVVLGESGSNVCNARVTPTFELADEGCNVSNVCNAGDRTTPTQPQSTDGEKKQHKEFEVGNRVVVTAEGLHKGTKGQVTGKQYLSRTHTRYNIKLDKPSHFLTEIFVEVPVEAKWPYLMDDASVPPRR